MFTLNTEELSTLKLMEHAPFDFVMIGCINAVCFWRKTDICSYFVSSEQRLAYHEKAQAYEIKKQQSKRNKDYHS